MTVIEGDMGRISEFTVRRLSNYFRILGELEKEGVSTVSSAKLADMGSITSAQVRKDLSYFGNFGTRGLGYNVIELKEAIMGILGLTRKWTLALFGAGALGHALFYHQGFRDDGFHFTNIFDNNRSKVGTEWLDVTIQPQSVAEETLTANSVDIGVIAIPPSSAAEVAGIMVRAGVRGVLNFAPTHITVPNGVWLRNVNLAVAMESLSFYLSQ